jgi:hypothetical protein
MSRATRVVSASETGVGFTIDSNLAAGLHGEGSFDALERVGDLFEFLKAL